MANICEFSMMIKGTLENRRAFVKALEQKGDIWMGRGAELWQVEEDWDDDATLIGGDCKWSVDSALIHNAILMRTEPERWVGIEDAKEIVTLWEACERWGITMEVYSKEGGCCFQEHMIYDGGALINECRDYYEHYFGDFETKEEAEEYVGIKLTDEQWKKDNYIEVGGYKWDFEI